jgi:crooked neck
VRALKEEGGTNEEEDAAVERVRDVYERAVAQVPPSQEKRHWRRYIFLWLDYALFEEIETKVCMVAFLSIGEWLTLVIF